MFGRASLGPSLDAKARLGGIKRESQNFQLQQNNTNRSTEVGNILLFQDGELVCCCALQQWVSNLSWSHKMADLSFFRFPGDGKLRKKWERFCRGADDKFKNLTDPLLWCCRSKDHVSH